MALALAIYARKKKKKNSFIQEVLALAINIEILMTGTVNKTWQHMAMVK